MLLKFYLFSLCDTTDRKNNITNNKWSTKTDLVELAANFTGTLMEEDYID